MISIKQIVMKNKILAFVICFVKDVQLTKRTKRTMNSSKSISKRIFYIGVPAHTNLGDLAQGVCIIRWLKKNFSNYAIVQIETNSLVNTRFSLLKKLASIYRDDDFIVFQSGYTTTDIGGYADEMHRAVMKELPNAKMLMMPQTIYFRSDENIKKTSKCYNAMKYMLFLARDEVSYEMAKKMFPDIPIMLYPDIVTTLIGSKEYTNKREGILFCCRDDEEKFYSDEELLALMRQCDKIGSVSRTDTTKKGKTKDIVKNAEKLIYNEIEEYAKYKIVITDRYHGTIFSLIAGTPVIIIKTTDHKVTTGAKWFNGVYDDYVYLAKDLNDAYELVKEVYKKTFSYKLEPYFEKEYYDKLSELFIKCAGD